MHIRKEVPPAAPPLYFRGPGYTPRGEPKRRHQRSVSQWPCSQVTTGITSTWRMEGAITHNEGPQILVVRALLAIRLWQGGKVKSCPLASE